jgi:phosphoribosylformylglycinamidine (FGAM) synthase-like amidotransferase family enzyme
VKHGEGRYVHPEPERLLAGGQVVFTYAPGQNPNGALADIAGVRNVAGNVVGLMPHPEHAVDPLLGPTGGRALFASVLGAPLPTS